MEAVALRVGCFVGLESLTLRGDNMVKMYCDRCGEEIKGTMYYTVNISTDDINPNMSEAYTYLTSIQNVATNTLSLFGSKNQYCNKCIDEISAFIYNGRGSKYE